MAKPKRRKAPTGATGGTRFCFISDTHGDHLDKPVYSIFREWMKSWKPTIRIAGGDHFDFRWLRSRASDNEKAEEIQADITAGLDFIRDYKPTHFMYGNHDDRLNRAKESYIGAVKGLGIHIQEEIDHALGSAKVYPYCKRNGVLRLGDVNFIHGFGSGIGSVRRAGLVYGRVVQGHIHSVENIPVERHERGFAMAAGCMCKLDLGYNAAHLAALRQQHGWCYGLIRPNGKTIVWQAHENGGAWILPSEMKQWHVPSGKH
jgi:hypothetical protein